MSRSRRKHPICAITGASHVSNKKDKRIANKKLRLLAKKRIRAGRELMPLLREVSDVYAFAYDGCMYFGKLKDGDKREKDIYDQLMRK